MMHTDGMEVKENLKGGRAAQGVQTRLDLVTAARQVFGEQGFAATSTEEIAARAVLGWDVVRDLDTRFGAVGLRGALRKAMTAGDLERKPLRPLALMLAGALNEACLYVADADDPVVARQEVEELITGLLSGLRTPTSAGVADT